jgi:hypothetical protein
MRTRVWMRNVSTADWLARGNRLLRAGANRPDSFDRVMPG